MRVGPGLPDAHGSCVQFGSSWLKWHSKCFADSLSD